MASLAAVALRFRWVVISKALVQLLLQLPAEGSVEAKPVEATSEGDDEKTAACRITFMEAYDGLARLGEGERCERPLGVHVWHRQVQQVLHAATLRRCRSLAVVLQQNLLALHTTVGSVQL